MKAFYILPLALLVAACGNDAPSIDDLKEDSYPLVEQVLTEDDADALSHRLDRYTLDTLRSLESGTVLLECKDGAWEPLGEEDVLNVV